MQRLYAKLIVCFGLLSMLSIAHAEVFLTVEQARQELFAKTPMHKVDVTLSRAQVKAIKKASTVRVLTPKLNAWKTDNNEWFLVDQVIGKHEMIDMAVAIDSSGKIKGLRVLRYVESYGSEVRYIKWLDQFNGRDSSEKLLLDEQVDNISGATLSCRHITDGVNRWTHTWNEVLRHL